MRKSVAIRSRAMTLFFLLSGESPAKERKDDLGPQHLWYKETGNAGIVQPGEEKAWRDFDNAYLKGRCKEDKARPFSVMPSDRIRSNADKLKYRKVHLYTGKHFFIVTFIKYQHMVPGEVEASLSSAKWKRTGGNRLALAVSCDTA